MIKTLVYWVRYYWWRYITRSGVWYDYLGKRTPRDARNEATAVVSPLDDGPFHYKKENVITRVSPNGTVYTWAGYRKNGKEYTWMTWYSLDEETDDQSS